MLMFCKHVCPSPSRRPMMHFLLAIDIIYFFHLTLLFRNMRSLGLQNVPLAIACLLYLQVNGFQQCVKNFKFVAEQEKLHLPMVYFFISVCIFPHSEKTLVKFLEITRLSGSSTNFLSHLYFI